MVGAGQGVLDVAEYRIGPSRFRAPGRGHSAAHHHRPIDAAGGGDARNAGQPIRGVASAGAEMLPRPSGGFAEPSTTVSFHAQRASLHFGLDGGDNGSLAECATTELAPISLATEIGVIEFGPSTEPVHAVALHHHLDQVVTYLPRRVVGDAQMAVQFHRRDTYLVPGDEGDGWEPYRERQLCGIEDGPRSDRGHAVAVIARLELAGVELPASVMAAVRAKKSIQPPPWKEGVEAPVFGSIERDEFADTGSFLEMHRVRCHSTFLFVIKLYGDISSESILHFKDSQNCFCSQFHRACTLTDIECAQ